MIAVTIDVDWAPDLIVKGVMEVVDRRGIPVTLYCTDYTTDVSGNSSSLLEYGDRHELGLHPNFQSTLDYDAVLERALKLYPGARGFRSHNGCSGWLICVAAARRGLVYEVPCPVYPVYIPPFKVNRDVLDHWLVTQYFLDAQMLTVPGFDWSLGSLWFAGEAADPEKLFVLGFHPSILYYDMTTAAEYERRKPEYHAARPAESFAAKSRLAGAMKFFRELLQSFPPSVFATPYTWGRCRGLWS